MYTPQETTKTVVDAASFITVLGTLAEVLPAIAALFTVIWTAIRIYETATVQRLIKGDNSAEYK
jgi:hypothetical protein